MYADDDSDSEYNNNGHYKSPSWPPIRILQNKDHIAREAATMYLWELRRHDESYDPNQHVPSKTLLRDFAALPQFEHHPAANWRRHRFYRFFHEIYGFHVGELDLTARSLERYNKLHSTWIKFFEDFSTILGSLGAYSPDSAPPVTSRETLSDRWDAFRTRWSIPAAIPTEQILRMITLVVEVMRAKEPIIQKLHLVDLPPEILDIVYSLSEIDDARALSATCHYLRETGRADIFLTRQLLVYFPCSVSGLLGECTGHELRSEVRRQLSERISACLAGYLFLLSRPDIASQIQYLESGCNWPECMAGIVGGDYAQMFDELHGCLLELLPMLRLCHFEAFEITFDVTLAQRFAEQPDLSVCNLHVCTTTPALQEHVRTLAPDAPRSALQTLTVRIRDYDDSSFWPLLAFCPSLRLLHVYAFRMEDNDPAFVPPTPSHMSRISPAIRNLERMCFEGVHCSAWLVDWLQNTVAQGPMRLSHLKLEFSRHMPDAFMIDLLLALHAGAVPLEVLALDGLIPASVELVQTISELFPDLVALTLFRRAGKRPKPSTGAKRSRWPGAVFEYAATFRNFTRLRHFAANLYFDCDALSPSVLDSLLSTAGEVDDDDYVFECVEDVARPFAAYCPTMKTFNLDGYRGRAVTSLTISRSACGDIVMGSAARRLTPEPPDEIWDPDSYRPWTLPPHTASERRSFARRPDSYALH